MDKSYSAASSLFRWAGPPGCALQFAVAAQSTQTHLPSAGVDRAGDEGTAETLPVWRPAAFTPAQLLAG